MVFSARTGFSRTRVEALSNLTLSIAPKDMLVLVGESGSGKTTLGRVIAGLQRPSSGRVLFNGTEVSKLKGLAHREYRRSVQLLHQDPFTALNPSLTVERSLVPAIRRWKIVETKQQAKERAAECLRLVGLSAEEFLGKYPHQMSGGQKQRVAIARCISIDPKLIILDEPVSMIDVSLRIGILDTLVDIRERLGTAFVFVTHDFAVARYFCEKAGGGKALVLYAGKVMETGPYDNIIDDSANPYTIALLGASPEEESKSSDERVIAKLGATEAYSPGGCRFEPRCVYAQNVCKEKLPPLTEVQAGHFSACHFAPQVREQHRSGAPIPTP